MKTNVRQRIFYGLGDTGYNFLFDMGQLYLLKYFTDHLGLPSVWAGSVFLVAKVWDAFADISVGTWIDNRMNIGPKGKFETVYVLLGNSFSAIACCNILNT